MAASTTNLLRHLSVLPLAAVGFLLGACFGLLLLGIVDRYCPPDLIASLPCPADWYPLAERLVFSTGTGTAAVLVILSSLVAPSHTRIRWAFILYGIGAVLGAPFAGVLPAEFITSLVAGGLVIIAILRSHARPAQTQVTPNI